MDDESLSTHPCLTPYFADWISAQPRGRGAAYVAGYVCHEVQSGGTEGVKHRYWSRRFDEDADTTTDGGAVLDLTHGSDTQSRLSLEGRCQSMRACIEMQ